MKKIGIFTIGTVFGLALSLTTGVFADNAQVNGVISQFKILINGKETPIENKIVNIDGNTFLPVREISNKLGYEVQFQDGTISLSNDKKQYLKEDKVEGTPVSTDASTSEKGYVKDLKSKYSKDGKLNVDLVTIAIEKGELTKDSQDETTGNSLVILSIKENNYPVFNYLATSGANLELQNKEGNTPLHSAVIDYNDFFVSALTSKYKVNAKIKNNEGKMPIDYVNADSTEYRILRPYSR